jgi:hypothetical protein
MMQKLKKVDNVNGKRRAYYYLKNEDWWINNFNNSMKLLIYFSVGYEVS